jgi:hypothetical protein
MLVQSTLTTPHNGVSFPKKQTMKRSYFCKPGPWGRLEVMQTLLSPPGEFCEFFEDEKRHKPWHFPKLAPTDVIALFYELGWPYTTVSELLANSTMEQVATGTDLFPSFDFVKTLDSDLRAELYGWLANVFDDSRQSNAYRFYGDSLEDWLRDAPLKPATVELLRPYIYKKGDFLCFADLAAVITKLHDPHETSALIKALTREVTLFIKLHVNAKDDINSLVNYWGRGKREREIRPLLESLVHFPEGMSLDIVHLLPRLPRNLLYTYPRPGLDEHERLRTCYWSSMNFFAEEPDHKFLEIDQVAQVLQQDWQQVNSTPMLGDIALFHDNSGAFYHAAVHIADDLLFTKNGPGLVRPWMLIHQEYLQHFYWRNAELAVQYYRRNDLM